jgi:acyl-ACP thioesterase
MMEKLNIWQESVPVRFGDIDRSDRLTLAAIFDFFQEAAISHADNLGVGRDSMAQTRQVWILSRMSVQVDRRPKYGETIKVRSWPRGGEKLFALRDYDIRDALDKPLVRGRSGWIILDMEKRRPLRPQALMEGLPQNEGLDALPSGAAGLAELKNPQKAAQRQAGYSDLDYNGHVNNVRYIQWIQDILDPALLEGAGRMRLDINYLNEILPGETIELWQAQAEGLMGGVESAPGETGDAEGTPGAKGAPEGALPSHAFAFEGRKAEGGQLAFRAELRLWGD